MGCGGSIPARHAGGPGSEPGLTVCSIPVISYIAQTRVMSKSQKSQKVEKIILYEGVGEVFKTSAGEITEAELIARINQGESFVVEVDKDNVRALTVTTMGVLVYNDTQEPVRNTMEVEKVEQKEEKKK